MICPGRRPLRLRPPPGPQESSEEFPPPLAAEGSVCRAPGASGSARLLRRPRVSCFLSSGCHSSLWKRFLFAISLWQCNGAQELQLSIGGNHRQRIAIGRKQYLAHGTFERNSGYFLIEG